MTGERKKLERLKPTLHEKYNEPTFLIDFTKEDIDFGIFCNGETEIEKRPDGTKIIRCKGKTLYLEPRKSSRPRIWEISEP